MERRSIRRRIAVLSTGRQDWGILRGLCRLLRDDDEFQLVLLLGGMHCSPHFGLTRQMVVGEGFEPAHELQWISAADIQKPDVQAGNAVWMTARSLTDSQPEAVILVGDRFEAAAAALGATLARVPIVHLHGGEETVGAIDNVLRHSITKLSHLHFTSHPAHTARVIAMGEDPGSVFTVGAPGLDNLHRADLPGGGELEAFLGIKLEPPVVLVTLHPATLRHDPVAEATAVVDAMDQVPATYVITMPNVDPGNEPVRGTLLAATHKGNRKAVEALGERRYWGMLNVADAMLGNSSSAIIEAPAIGLPAVNVGDRQKGRLRAGNVIDVAAEGDRIAQALRKALSPDFRAAARACGSPYGVGDSSRKILDVLRRWVPPNPPVKPSVAVSE